MAKVAFTAGRVRGFKCKPGKTQAFLWDSTAPGLGLRATPAGKPAYIVQSRFEGQTIRMTIGSLDAWSIPQAQEKARQLQRQIDEGRDPREVKAETIAADVAKRDDTNRLAVTVDDAWTAYLEERRPRWSERHYSDHLEKAAPGGEPGKRGGVIRLPGPLNSLMPLALRDLDAAMVESWAAHEAETRPTSARLAWRLLKAFLGWCAEQPAYSGALPPVNPAKSKRARESLGKPGIKQDALQREQLKAWFDAVRQMKNPVVAAYLQTLLLTGARPGEVLALRWEDMNTKWKGLTIRDKVEGERTIPLTAYVAHLLAGLPRRNEWVFSSASSKGGALTIPRNHHVSACVVAELEDLTLHGLRRSFKSLTEWLEVPAGVVAQLMGHKPSATAEKHYTVRPLDLLRVHHQRIETWILEQAGITFDATIAPGALRVVAAS